MAITKTNFKNYIRCPRYAALDNFKKEELDKLLTLDEYKKQELDEDIQELMGTMVDEDGNSLIDVPNAQLEVMMPYYTKVETIAGAVVDNLFEGDPIYAASTFMQESFDVKINGIRYMCYVDIFNDRGDAFDIIEVKATTTNKFLSIGKSFTDVDGKRKTNSIFEYVGSNIFKLKEEIPGFAFDDDLPEKSYLTGRQKLFDKFGDAGKYVYDLAVQRYIIENDLKNNGEEEKADKIKYYLGILNHEYVFDGTYEDGEPKYTNEIISFIDLTKITKDYMDKVDIDRKAVEDYINKNDSSPCKLGKHCEMKKTTRCKFYPTCFKDIPAYNSIFNYIGNHNGFKDDDNYKHDRFDLVNEGKFTMLDIPDDWLKREPNVIQKRVLINKDNPEINPYINKKKVRDGINEIKFPIYHLDFETFPCPLPRFNGEKAYTQSVFQFSLHIEREPGVCDKETDHIEFLAPDAKDRRLELVKKMCDSIGDKGTILAYNDSFEKSRMKELGEIFPEYKEKLKDMIERTFDLMNVVKTKSSLYEELGYDKNDAKLFNYYHNNMNGSFSIKKILPLFTELTYVGMEVANGIEALITYARFPYMTENEYEFKYSSLIDYCKQDTWAMVEILKGLRELVK